MPGWKSLSGSTRNCLHQDGKPIFFTSLPPRRSRQFLVAGFPADCRRVLPAASSERKQAKDPKKLLYLLPLTARAAKQREPQEEAAKDPQKPSYLFPVILIFPCGKTEESTIRSHAEKLFSCKKFFSLQPPTGSLQIHFSKMRPTDRVFRPLRRATRAPRPGSSLPLRSAPWLCATGTRRPRQAEPGRNPRLQRGRTTT